MLNVNTLNYLLLIYKMEQDKIIVKYICPNCQSQQSLRKQRDAAEGLLNCPQCKKALKFVFDTTTEPQQATVRVLTSADIPSGQQRKPAHRETVYVGKAGMPGSGTPDVPGVAGGMGPQGSSRPDKSTMRLVPGAMPPPPPAAFAGAMPGQPHMQPQMPGQFQGQMPGQQQRLLPLNEPVFIARLGGLFGKSQKEKFQLFEGRTVIGRQDPMRHSDIEFSHDPEMSRQSLEIFITPNYVRGNEYRLTVLRSTNLVYVNNFPVRVGESTFLQFGDIITLGNTKLLFDNK